MKGLLLILAFLSARILFAQDSPVPTDPTVQAMRDSLETGIRELDTWYRMQQREASDSLKQAIQNGPALAWRDWAMKYAPRKGMSGEDILRLADLHARLNAFDMTGSYNEQLECYKRAMVMPGTEERALYRLHAEYLSAGFAPGMIQTGSRLLALDKDKAMAQGVGRSMALAYYFVGDRKEATRWVKRHLREHPGDRQAKDLRKRIKELQPIQP